jgi:hypothetical protein
MWFPNVDILRSDDQRSAFLLLAWQEMFDPVTPDSFQPRFSHTASLVSELGAVASKASISDKWLKHVRVIQDELKSVAGEEDEMLRRRPQYVWAIGQLVSQAQSATQIACLAKTLYGEGAEYNAMASAALRESAADLPKTKDATMAALSRWATVAIRANRTPAQLIQVATEQNMQRQPAEVVNFLLSAATPKTNQYECVLAVTGTQNLIQTVARKARFSPRSKADFKQQMHLDFLRQLPSASTLVSCSLGAESPEAAAKAAVRQLRDATDIFNFYNNSLALLVEPLALIIEFSSEVMTCVQLGEPSLRKLRPRRNAALYTHEVLDKVSKDRLSGRILNALEHYSLAYSSAEARVQLVNLWSAIECLVGSEDSESVINSVSKTVVPIVVYRRSDKLLTHLAMCLHQSRRAGADQPLGSGFSKTNESYVSREELILVLTKPENHPDMVGLLKFAGWHPLLANRVFTLWRTFSQPKALNKALRLSQQRIIWQLHRIYGSSDEFVPKVRMCYNTGSYESKLTLSCVWSSGGV